jgi:hypothetical protein
MPEPKSKSVQIDGLKVPKGTKQPKLCCGGIGRHEPGCPKRVAELARSGRFDD